MIQAQKHFDLPNEPYLSNCLYICQDMYLILFDILVFVFFLRPSSGNRTPDKVHFAPLETIILPI